MSASYRAPYEAVIPYFREAQFRSPHDTVLLLMGSKRNILQVQIVRFQTPASTTSLGLSATRLRVVNDLLARTATTSGQHIVIFRSEPNKA